jgi:hypothetical protein
MSNRKIIRGFRFSLVWCCHLISGFWDFGWTLWVSMFRAWGSVLEISGTINQQCSVTSKKITCFWISPLSQPQISHKIYFQLFFFIFWICDWIKKFCPKLLKLFDCFFWQPISCLYMVFNRIVLDCFKCS